MSKNDFAIRVHGVSKEFRLPHERHTSIKSLFLNLFRNKRTFERQQVLQNISFDIKKGEFFGIVGRNGSGKSTLLKLLAGIYEPDEGHIVVNGKLTPFIELGVGFNPELTGKENVYLNGVLLGFDRKEMSSMYESIVEFAELEKFMDQQLKNYSSGMQVRLAFAIAIRASTAILLLDEVLAVGDAAFQKKCFDYFSDLKQQGKTVVLVSHSMDAVKKFCTNGILIEAGKIVHIGDSTSISDKYEEMFVREAQQKSQGDYNLNENISIESAEALHEGRYVGPKDKIKIKIALKAKKDIKAKANYGINLYNEAGVLVFATGNKAHSLMIPPFNEGQQVIIEHDIANHFTDGVYHINIAVETAETKDLLLKQPRVAEFFVKGWQTKHSLLQADNTMSVTLE